MKFNKKEVLARLLDIEARLTELEEANKQDKAELKDQINNITAQINLEVGDAFLSLEMTGNDQFFGMIRKITEISTEGKIFFDEKVLESDPESESAKYSVAEKAMGTSEFLESVVYSNNFVQLSAGENNTIVSFMSKRNAKKFIAKAMEMLGTE